MKIAIVHDQLVEFGGAERVLVALKEMFPDANIYTTVYSPSALGHWKNKVSKWKIITSWFGKIPVIKMFYSPFRFLTPLIWESFDFSKYDLVISSSGSWMSKGIITKKPTVHISYVHHPPRYLYGYETAIEWQKYPIVRLYALIVNHFLRLWDFNSSQRADLIIANSRETQKRIEKFYRRKSVVVYPPVEIPKNPVSVKGLGKYYLTVSRLARAKHIEILIKAANKYGFALKVIGTGRDERYLKSIAGKTVEFLGNVADGKFEKYHRNAKAFLFASRDEEFGIAAVEAMGYGLPVIAFRSGGIPEYVKDKENGLLFDNLHEDSLIDKIKIFESFNLKTHKKMKANARNTAQRFSSPIFKKNILKLIRSKTNAGTA